MKARKYVPVTSMDELQRIYNDSMISGASYTPEAINRGFAYLAHNPKLFQAEALESFYRAKNMDTGGLYIEAIESGINAAENVEKELPIRFMGYKEVIICDCVCKNNNDCE